MRSTILLCLLIIGANLNAQKNNDYFWLLGSDTDDPNSYTRVITMDFNGGELNINRQLEGFVLRADTLVRITSKGELLDTLIITDGHILDFDTSNGKIGVLTSTMQY